MKRAFVLSLLACLLIPALVLAKDFDCVNPAFGDEIGNYEHFLKYKEKGGIEYYNYTGPCELPVLMLKSVDIAYGVIDGKIYAQIISVHGEDVLRFLDFQVLVNLTSKRIQIMTAPETKKEGDWDIAVWKDEEKKLKAKLKQSIKTGQFKLAFYYWPLKGGLEEAEETEDQLSP